MGQIKSTDMNSPKQNEQDAQEKTAHFLAHGWTEPEASQPTPPLIADVEKAAQLNAETEYSGYPFPNDNWSYKAVRLAHVEGAKFGANHPINLGYKSPAQVKAICKAVLERAADESDSGCYCSDGVSKQSILNIDLEEFLK